MTYYDHFESPVGRLLLTGDGENLTGLYLENHKGGPSVAPAWHRDPARLETVRKQLDAYFAGKLTEFDLPLNLEGTAFQRDVWRLLEAIPYGQTVTYGELAKQLGKPDACRAVGAAVGRNPISIIVPCHRVLGSTGAITGYAGGTARKAVLLDLEGICLL